MQTVENVHRAVLSWPLCFRRLAMAIGDPLFTLFLPISVGVIMLGLGLSLTPADFARVAQQPRAVLICLACQVMVLPLLCLLVVLGFRLEPALAVGMLLIAASPGGTAANLYSHLAHGDVALNLTLTALSSVVAVLSMPLIVNLALLGFMSGGAALALQFGKVVQVFVVVLGPVAVGMFVRHLLPALSQALYRPVKLLSALLVVVIVVATVRQNWQTLLDYAPVLGAAALTFNLLSLALGYSVSRLLALGRAQAIAIGLELGIHNAPLAIALALSPALLGNATMAVPPAMYGVVMLFTAGLFGWCTSRAWKRRTTPRALL